MIISISVIYLQTRYEIGGMLAAAADVNRYWRRDSINDIL